MEYREVDIDCHIFHPNRHLGKKLLKGKVMQKRYSWEEAWDLAIEVLGYPCPCENCSDDGGKAKAEEISQMAKDLSGLDY